MSSYIENDTDVNVEGVELYVKDSADGYAYIDSKFSKRINSKTLKHLFEMNDIVIVDHDVRCRGIAMKLETDSIVVSYTYPVIKDNNFVLESRKINSFDKYLVTDIEIAPDEDLFGKVVSDLQSDIEITESEITGTLNHVTGYTGFSSKTEEQSGNYLVLHNTSNLDDPIFVEVIGGYSGPVQLDSDGLIVLRIANNEQKVKVTCGNLSKEYSLANLTLLNE